MSTHQVRRSTSTTRRWLAGLAAGGLLAAACGAGAVRPQFSPFPSARSDTLTAPPDSVVRRLGGILNQRGIEVRWLRLTEGYVETRWFRVDTSGIGKGRGLDTESTVRLRFWVNAYRGRETILVGEAVRRRMVDPSLTDRQQETPLAPEHPGHELLWQIMDSLEPEFRD